MFEPIFSANLSLFFKMFPKSIIAFNSAFIGISNVLRSPFLGDMTSYKLVKNKSEKFEA